MSPSAGLAGGLVTTPAACPAGPGLGVGAGVISGTSPAAPFFGLRIDTRLITSRKAIIRAMSPSTGVAGVLETTPNASPTLGSAAGLVLSGPGLGVGSGVISGKSPAAFPAPTVVTTGPGRAAAWMAPRRPAVPPGPMSELVAPFGFGGGPGGGTLADG